MNTSSRTRGHPPSCVSSSSSSSSFDLGGIRWSSNDQVVSQIVVPLFLALVSPDFTCASPALHWNRKKDACNADNALRAVERYVRETSTSFCSGYLATPKSPDPSNAPTFYGSSRISSACHCLTMSAPPAVATITTTLFGSTTRTTSCSAVTAMYVMLEDTPSKHT